MGRNIGKLRAFVDADALVVDVYASTRDFPSDERFGLQMQMRRAAVSIPCNLAEGSERRTTRDFLHFVSVACGSASEARYLAGLAQRLQLLDAETASNLQNRYDNLIRSLQKLITSLDRQP